MGKVTRTEHGPRRRAATSGRHDHVLGVAGHKIWVDWSCGVHDGPWWTVLRRLRLPPEDVGGEVVVCRAARRAAGLLSPARCSEGPGELAERVGEAHILAVVDRTGDDRHGVTSERLAQRGQQITGRAYGEAPRTEALGIRHEIGV